MLCLPHHGAKPALGGYLPSAPYVGRRRYLSKEVSEDHK